MQRFYFGLQHNFNFIVLPKFFTRNFIGAKLRTVNEINFFRVLRQKVCRVNRRISTAHNRNNFVAVHMPVAKFAVVNAFADVFFFLLERQFPALHTGRDYNDFGFVNAGVRFDEFGIFFQTYFLNDIKFINHRAETFRLSLNRRDKVFAGNIRQSRIIFNAGRVGNLPADNSGFQNENGKIHSSGVKSRRQSGHAGTDYHDIFFDTFFLRRHDFPLSEKNF